MTKELIEEMKNVLTEQKNQMLESLAEKNADFKKLVNTVESGDAVDIASDAVDRTLLDSLSAQDSDVIKTYVALGLGIGLVAEQSSGEQEEENLIRLDTRHLFDANTVWLGLKRGQLQRNYVWRFLELCNAGLSVEDIKRQVMENSEEEIDYQI